MERGHYQKKRIAAIDWIYREGAQDLLTVDFEKGGVLTGVSENRVRIRGLYRVGDETYFVKVFKDGGLGRTLKSLLLGHVAQKEFLASRYLDGKGIRTPEVIAVGSGHPCKDRAVIIFRAVRGAAVMWDLFLKAAPNQKERYLSSLAAVTARLHRARFHHRDYHAGNLLTARRDGGGSVPWVIDLHRSTFPRDMSAKRGIGNIADLLHSLLPSLGDGDIDFFLSRYKAENPDARWEISDARRHIDNRIKRIEEVRLASRTRRCFKNSTEFTVTRRRDGVIYAARVIKIDEVERILRDFAQGSGKVIKRDRKATIALLRSGPKEICVKAYLGLTLSEKIRAMLRSSRGHVSWRSARALNLRGFETPRQLCLVVARRFFVPRAIYLMSASIRPDLEMDRFILKELAGNARTIASFAGALGTFVGRLHRAGVYHRDLKGTNIAVQRNGSDFVFSLLDLDSVSFGHEVSARRRAKNLAQIFLSTPGAVGAAARRAFCEAYGNALGGPEGKDVVWRRVEQMVRDKDILYVGPAGDVVEDARALFDELWGGKGH